MWFRSPAPEDISESFASNDVDHAILDGRIAWNPHTLSYPFRPLDVRRALVELKWC